MSLLTTRDIQPGRGFLERAAEVAWQYLEAQDQPAAAAHVVVPTAAQIPATRQALQAVAARSGRAGLLPRILTLGHWLLDVPPLPDDPLPRTHLTRLLTVQQAIRSQSWLQQIFGLQGEGAAWGLAQTMLTVGDELSRRWLTLDAAWAGAAEDDADYETRLQAALAVGYDTLAERFLGEESRIVMAFWRTLADRADPVPVRLQGMARLAEQVDGPVIWLAPTPPEHAEQAWLERLAQRVPVLQIGYAWHADVSNETTPSQASVTELATLLQAWPECRTDAAEVREAPAHAEADHGAAGVSQGDEPPWPAPAIRLCGAARFEDEALMAAQTLVNWLNEGRKQLALVAHDRVVARRVRALLARAGAPVSDETGWKLSTTRAAAALMRWFDIVVTGGDSQALLDFLKSPYCLPAMEGRSQRIGALEALIRRYGVTGGWARLKQVAERDSQYADPGAGHTTGEAPQQASAVQELIAQLADEASRWVDPGKRPLGAWLALAEQTFDHFDMRAALVADEAGRQLLECLRRLGLRGDAVQMASVTLSLAEWRALIGVVLESEVFKEPAPAGDCRIVVLPLNGARMRRFEGVVVVGCDDGQLPSAAPELMFLSNAVRRELGLADREARFAQQARDLAEVLLNNAEVVLTWQRTGSQGEPRALSGWLQRLAQRYAAHGVTLAAKVALPVLTTRATPQKMPQPIAPTLVPNRLSAAGYQALRRCPYQFFATRMLRLAELDEPSEQLEKRAVGELLHATLLRYHQAVAEAPADHAGDAERLALLTAISREVFQSLLTYDGNVLPFYHRWEQVMPGYVAWQREREAQGWQWQAGEVVRAREMTLDDGHILTLHGRLDRLDRQRDGTLAVLDYKTQPLRVLRDKPDEIFEDCQLAFYGLLEPDVAEGAWVALENSERDGMDVNRAVELPGYATIVDWLARQLGEDIVRLRAGEPLPAFGDEAACRYCEARGLCRKGFWEGTA
ncbi:recombinase RecB [Imbroritus primus]|uniref:Recombinase RecB n=1 Tax=Imbroritus primus TaxID=3058603 RepID=A0ACD3SMT0_9BURK|nr:recombinase RecB [Burkholderiaceae bacterium PBA]